MPWSIQYSKIYSQYVKPTSLTTIATSLEFYEPEKITRPNFKFCYTYGLSLKRQKLLLKPLQAFQKYGFGVENEILWVEGQPEGAAA